ncbi:MAG: DUF456 domain-containing protein [Methylacidiphilales bacterium]|nr:DUF456 domain-containing protein [Candidatus Methylacidiphilales bacterium]MDW8349591.1 DUF456 domain-containing protein [Verrucomicrobiae bacterium]
MLNETWFTFACAVLGVSVGILGTLLPMIPGLGLIFFVIAAVKLLQPDRIENILVVAAAVAWIGLWVAEFFAGMLGAKLFGGTRWGMLGALVGGIIGVFFFPIGIIFGPMIGAIGGELLAGRNSLPESFKVGIGAGGSFLILTAIKLAAAVTLGLIFIADYWAGS